MKLYNRNAEVIFDANVNTMKDLVELAVKKHVDLQDVDLQFADLQYATLQFANLQYADSFDDDIRLECTHGIHFFVTKKEAEQY